MNYPIAFFIGTTFEDANDLVILMEGMRAHSECTAFPAWANAEETTLALLKIVPRLRYLDDVWSITLYDYEALETLNALLSSVEWKKENEIFITDGKCEQRWNLYQFHKAVTVDGSFKEDG